MIDMPKIEQLNIKHLRPVNSNSVCGVTLANQNPQIIKGLKNAGIETYIDLRHNAGEELSRKCQNTGMNYFSLPLKMNYPVFINQANTKLTSQEYNETAQKFINELSKFFELMNNGKYYMSCMLGLHRTDLAVTMNYLLNPEAPQAPPLLSHMHFAREENRIGPYVSAIKNLFKNFTDENKTMLKWNNIFETGFNNRINLLKEINKFK